MFRNRNTTHPAGLTTLSSDTSTVQTFESDWSPIVSADEVIGEFALGAVAAIMDAVFEKGYTPPAFRKQPPNFETALLCTSWALGRNEPIWIERAVEELNFTADNNHLGATFLGLHGGLCGAGWIMQYVSDLLTHQGVDRADLSGAEDPNSEIDWVMLKALDRPLWNESYDATGGLVGYGVYFLERLPRDSAVQALHLIVNHLGACAEYTGGAIGWRSSSGNLSLSMQSQCPDGYYNLGAAHGIAGVIYFLSELLDADIEPERSQFLLTGAFEWLLSHQRPPGSVSKFSSWMTQEYSFDTQPAWCYGDFGIAAILIRAARQTGRNEWIQFAHALLDSCLAWPVHGSGVQEAGLCHGACGVAHIFNRLYHSEGDPRCKDAALKWLELAMGMWQPGKGVGGFAALTRPHALEDIDTHPDYEFLHGSVGVALALLAALTPVEPQWDRMLLLSGRN